MLEEKNIGGLNPSILIYMELYTYLQKIQYISTKNSEMSSKLQKR